jgi:hypothetical protein
MTITKAGHFVPANNYITTAQMLQDYIQSRSLACHGVNGCSVVDFRCQAMNQCNSQGVCGKNG